MSSAIEYFMELAGKYSSRNFYAQLLSATGKPETFEIYENLLGEGRKEDPAILVQFGDDKSIEHLQVVLIYNDYSDRAVFSVISALARYGTPRMKPLLGILLKLLGYILHNFPASDSSDRWRYHVMYSMFHDLCNAVQKIAGQKEIINILAGFLKDDEDLRVREKVINKLLSIGLPESIEPVLDFFNSNNDPDRLSKEETNLRKRVLILSKDPQTVESLIQASNGSDPSLRKQAIKELISANIFEPVLELLRKALNVDHRDYNLIIELILLLSDGAPLSPLDKKKIEIEDTELLSLLLLLLKDNDFLKYWNHIIPDLLRILGATKNPCVTAHITKFLKSNDEYLRENAALALGVLGDARAVKPLLESLPPAGRKRGMSLSMAALQKISATHLDEVIDDITLAYNGGIISKDDISQILFFTSSIRYHEAYVQYYLGKKGKYSYTSFLTSDSAIKVAECCKPKLNIGDEAIAILNERNEKESIHALACDAVKEAYWS